MGDTFHCGIELENFDPEEFFCPCCGIERMNEVTLIRHQMLRTDYGKPLGVVPGGGYRCSEYDKTNSAHKSGQAIDAQYPKSDHFLLVELAIKHGFTGIGDKNRYSGYQLHIDDADEIQGVRPRPWKWTY